MLLQVNKNILLVLIFILTPFTIANIYAKSSSFNNPGIPKRFNLMTVEGFSETFTITIKVYEGLNVYGWQVNLLYDPAKLAVVKVEAGDYLSKNSIIINSTGREISKGDIQDFEIGYAMLFYATDVRPNLVLIGGCLWGDVPEVDGSGTVAKITFGCLENSHGPYYVDLGDYVLVNKHCEVVNQGRIEIELSE